MAVRMLLLLLTAVTTAAVALIDSMLTTDLLEIVLCLWTFAHRPFATGRLRDVILRKLHEGTRWSIELYRPTGDGIADSSVLQDS